MIGQQCQLRTMFKVSTAEKTKMSKYTISAKDSGDIVALKFRPQVTVGSSVLLKLLEYLGKQSLREGKGRELNI